MLLPFLPPYLAHAMLAKSQTPGPDWEPPHTRPLLGYFGAPQVEHQNQHSYSRFFIPPFHQSTCTHAYMQVQSSSIPPLSPDPSISTQNTQNLGTTGAEAPPPHHHLRDNSPLEPPDIKHIQNDANKPGIVHGCTGVLVHGQRGAHHHIGG